MPFLKCVAVLVDACLNGLAKREIILIVLACQMRDETIASCLASEVDTKSQKGPSVGSCACFRVVGSVFGRPRRGLLRFSLPVLKHGPRSLVSLRAFREYLCLHSESRFSYQVMP